MRSTGRPVIGGILLAGCHQNIQHFIVLLDSSQLKAAPENVGPARIIQIQGSDFVGIMQCAGFDLDEIRIPEPAGLDGAPSEKADSGLQFDAATRLEHIDTERL